MGGDERQVSKIEIFDLGKREEGSERRGTWYKKVRRFFRTEPGRSFALDTPLWVRQCCQRLSYAVRFRARGGVSGERKMLESAQAICRYLPNARRCSRCR